ncbi:MAG: amidohydrolase [Candidatus Ozemobacter sibiricus]|uniref:Amidohydrolase n=1 Tax=Candidatus Ozemobacter sibiricus TaxID=2268124 RepID=A0A367ZKP7_9BACT|nr:MAG: amidohydrolase [Candidatus Ozemobacter sibiricus]
MSILFDNIRLYMAGAFFPGQKVLVEKGKIAAVGSKILKTVDETIDGKGKYLMPALIDAHTHLGLFERGNLTPGSDMAEVFQPITPHLRPLDGIKMRDQALEDARRAGVAVCMVCPGPTNPIAGQCSILKTNGNSADVGLIVEQAGIKICFGEEPKNTYHKQKKAPSTRMGVAALIRETLMRAQDYAEQKASKKGIRDRNIQFEALLPMLEGRVPMRANAHRVEDIMTAIRIAEEFKLKLIIEHGTEAHLLAPMLAEKKIPVVLGPALVPHLRFELRDKTFESAVILMNAGVEVALTCDFPGLPIEALRIVAAMAVQFGLDEKRAINAITENPARILGIQTRCGQIKKGYDADLALFSGHPLDIRSKLEMIVVDGELFRF